LIANVFMIASPVSCIFAGLDKQYAVNSGHSTATLRRTTSRRHKVPVAERRALRGACCEAAAQFMVNLGNRLKFNYLSSAWRSFLIPDFGINHTAKLLTMR